MPNNNDTTEPNTLTDTGQALVAQAVREVRALLAQDVKSAVREGLHEEIKLILKQVKDAVTFFFSQSLK